MPLLLGQTPRGNWQSKRTKEILCVVLRSEKEKLSLRAWVEVERNGWCVSPEPARLDGWPMKQAQAQQATWAPASPNRGNGWWSQTPSTPREPLLRGPASPGLPPGIDQVQEQGDGTLFTRAAVPSYALWYLSPKQNAQGFRPRAPCSLIVRQG